MATQFLTYDDKYMQSGKFYQIHANLDQASAVVEVKLSKKIDFTNSTYINEEYQEGYDVQIWKVDSYNNKTRRTNITHSVEWYIEDSSLIITSNIPITGYIELK